MAVLEKVTPEGKNLQRFNKLNEISKDRVYLHDVESYEKVKVLVEVTKKENAHVFKKTDAYGMYDRDAELISKLLFMTTNELGNDHFTEQEKALFLYYQNTQHTEWGKVASELYKMNMNRTDSQLEFTNKMNFLRNVLEKGVLVNETEGTNVYLVDDGISNCLLLVGKNEELKEGSIYEVECPKDSLTEDEYLILGISGSNKVYSPLNIKEIK